MRGICDSTVTMKGEVRNDIFAEPTNANVRNTMGCWP